MKNDWFYNVIRIDDGLKRLIRKEHLIEFVSYLSKKIAEEPNDKEVPHLYVQKELEDWIMNTFGVEIEIDEPNKYVFKRKAVN